MTDDLATISIMIKRCLSTGSLSAVGTMLPTPLKVLWRLCIAVTGFTVLAVGIAMIVLPGPAIIVVPAGVAILATEFAWARHLQRKVRAYLVRCQNGKSR